MRGFHTRLRRFHSISSICAPFGGGKNGKEKPRRFWLLWAGLASRGHVFSKFLPILEILVSTFARFASLKHIEGLAG